LNLDNLTISKTIPSFKRDKGGKTLILLENEAQVQECLSWLDDLNGEKQIVALTPFAMYELDKHNVNYKIPEEYYSSEELYQVGIDNFRKVEELCNLIDTVIKQSNTEVVKYNIRPAMFSFRDLKIVYDTFVIRIFQLSKIINSEKPALIKFYNTLTYPFGEHESACYLCYDHRESIYSQVLSLEDWGIPTKTLPWIPICEGSGSEKNPHYLITQIKSNLGAWLQKHPELFDILILIHKSRYHEVLNWLKSNLMTSKDTPVLLYGSGYNWDDSIVELQAEGIAPVYRISDGFCWVKKSNEMNCHDLDQAWLDLLNNREFKKFFVINGIDIFPLLKERFRYLVKRLTFACMFAVQDTMELITKRNIKAVIASTFSTCVDHSVAQAAHNSGIPVITWQHGGYGAMENHPLINYFDLISSNVHFIYGDGVGKSYSEAAKIYGTKLVSIGSASLEYVKKKNIKEKNKIETIVYVTSSFLQNNLSISTYPPISDNLFLKTQMRIVDTLASQKKYSIIVKLHPSQNLTTPLQRYVSEKGYKNFHFIRREKTFTDLIPLADVVIIDLPFTTLLQALTTKKPIFAFTGHVYYNKHAQQLLKKRAVCSENLDVFLSNLDAFLKNNIYNPDVNNTEFLEEYGTTSGKNTASKRAAKELRRIINL